jgi:hypothetical protein
MKQVLPVMWLSFLIACSNGVAQTPPTTPVPPTLFGMHFISPSTPWPTIPIGAEGKGTRTGWPYIQATCSSPCSTFDWSTLDAWVSEAKVHNIDVMYAFYSVPPWAAADPTSCKSAYPGGPPLCSSMVSNISDWDNFVAALVTRYKGAIYAYELWNEPNIAFTGTINDMIALTQDAYSIIRSIDPTARILSPSGDAAYMDSYWSNGGLTTYDVLTFHAYPNPGVDIPEGLTGFLFQTTMLPVFKKYGLSTKPIWDTEGSWGDTSAGTITDNTLRSAFIARWYLLHWSEGVSRVYWYAWDNSAWGTLWKASTGAQPAADAFGQIQSWMLGTTMSSACVMQSGVDYTKPATWTCGLTRPNGYQALVLWNTGGNTSYTVPAQYTQYKTLSGTISKVPSNRIIMIGTSPLLVESSLPNPPTGLTAIAQ